MATIEPTTWEYVDDPDVELQIRIESRLLTPRGSRVGRPGYGSDIDKFIGRPLTSADVAVMRREITNLLSDLVDVSRVQIEQPDPDVLNFTINEIYTATVTS